MVDELAIKPAELAGLKDNLVLLYLNGYTVPNKN